MCIILDIIYNFNLKCKECNTDYNIVINQQKNTPKTVLNICSLICFLFLNLIIYGACAFLIIYPLILNKNDNNDPEKNKFEHVFYFFGGLIFIINTFFIFVVISSILYNNPQDINDYISISKILMSLIQIKILINIIIYYINSIGIFIKHK